MCCECCSVTQRKSWVFGLGIVFAALGITLLILWPDISLQIMHNNLVLKEGSESYDNWVDVPIPIYLEFHMFNWTNPEDIRNPNIKPNFVEMGPYVFFEKHHKENITFYPNHTVSYFENRFWYFDAEQSNGTLEDPLTAAHVITATVAEMMRHKSKIVKKVINFMLNHEGGVLSITKPVGEWIFEGYQDDLTDFLNLFNTSKIHIPYTRFGWLADRNGSAEYDGLFTIKTGVDDISQLGSLTHWNRKNETGYYPAPCGTVNGTTGDLFAPHLDTTKPITIFATDACRYLNIMPNGTVERYGITANNWVGTEQTFDSGINYPEQECFCNPRDEECPKAGVVECKQCRDNAPVYASFPHFYLADPSYVSAINGVKPDANKHEFQIAIEPYTGIPLKVNARLQINLLLQQDNDFDIYRGVQNVLMPMFWFEQRALLDKKLAARAKLAINLEDYGRYMAIALISLGGLLIVIGVVLTLTKSWKRTPADDEDILTHTAEPSSVETLPRRDLTNN